MAIADWTTRLKRLEVGEKLVRRNPFYYSPVRHELERLEDADLQTRLEWTRMRLDRMLCAARRTSYGRVVGAPRALSEWPLLTKDAVRDHPEAFCRLAWGGQWFNAVATTGGTTGVPLRLIRSPESVVAEQACQDLALERSGIDPRRARLAVLRADDVKNPNEHEPPYWIFALGGRRLIFSSNHLSERTLLDFVRALRDFAPDVLWVYPTPLEVLCLLLQQVGLRLDVRCVLSSSEVLQPQVWQLARDVLGCTLIDRYGQAERVACAHAFAPGAYRFVPGYSHVELVEAVREQDHVLYEIVGTSLWNGVMPLVRYRTGDLIRLPASYGERELTEVACGMRSFEGVIGRTNEVLLAPCGTSVLTGINHLPRGVGRLLRLQVAQESPDRVVLRVLAAPGFSLDDEAQLLKNARAKIPEPIEVRVEVRTELERTAGGKTPYVVHGPEVKEKLRAIGFAAAAR
ncbi:MAG: hypothetical protein C0P74_010395 [Gammaproteobacteria bacterium]|nr:hypothetical protein [Gammaproteobacteria bacterium]